MSTGQTYTIICRSLIGRSVVVRQGRTGALVSGLCLHALQPLLHGFCARESHGWELKLEVLLHRSRPSCTLKLRGVFLQSVKF